MEPSELLARGGSHWLRAGATRPRYAEGDPHDDHIHDQHDDEPSARRPA